jgi:lipoprotein-releasing system ATP-binding protein
MRDSTPILSAVDLHKSYRRYADTVQVLRGVDLDVCAGEFVSVLGASGCGKSTMLHLLGLLDKPDRGCIHFQGDRIDNLPRRERDQLRSSSIRSGTGGASAAVCAVVRRNCWSASA